MHRGKEGGGGETEKGAVEEMVFVDCGEQRAVVKVEKVEVSEGEDGWWNEMIFNLKLPINLKEILSI